MRAFDLARPDAPVARARVYRQESVLTRRVSLRLDERGRAEVALPLAPDVDPVAPVVRARWRDDEGGPACRVRPLPTRTDDIGLARRALEAEARADERRRRILDRHERSIRRFLRASWSWPEPPLERWAALIDQVARERGGLARRAVERQHRRAELDGQESQRHRAAEIRVDLRGAPHRPLVLECSFPYGGAGWSPSYELRLGEHAELVAVAHVFQSSRETWPDVRLELGTSLPHGSGPLPPLAPLLVSGFQGPPNAAGTYVSPEAPTPAGPAILPRSAPGPVTLSGDGVPTRVELFTRRLELSIRTEVDLSRGGVRRIGLTDAPEDLTAGPLAVFEGSAYLGRSQVPDAVRGAPLRVDLGASDRVRFERRVHPHAPTRSRGTNLLRHRFSGELVLTEPLGEPVDVDLVERLPVAGSADIEVELTELPAGMQVDPRTGEGHALVRLGSGVTRRFVWDYAIHAARTVVVIPED